VSELHGPFYVVLNADGTIHRFGKNQADSRASPCIFGHMGPHDNHTREGRSIVYAMLKLVPIEEPV